jgi:hypothetical protein
MYTIALFFGISNKNQIIFDLYKLTINNKNYMLLILIILPIIGIIINIAYEKIVKK